MIRMLGKENKKITNRRIFLFLILFALLVIIFNSDQTFLSIDQDSIDGQSFKKDYVALDDQRLLQMDYFNDNWIVVTSINKPTDQIRKLASIKEFQLLVVADRKTDPNWLRKTDPLYESVIFLSVDDQKNLGFQILDDIPFNSYTRKNIGNNSKAIQTLPLITKR
jgi:hypothetical protein